MRWQSGGVSDDVDDRRGESGGGGGGGLPIRGPLGCGVVVVLLLLSLFTGKNFLSLLDTGGGGSATVPSSAPARPQSAEVENRRVEFVSFVLDDVQKAWEQILGAKYEHTRLVLFRDGIRSACGFAESATGPVLLPGRPQGLHRPGVLR